MVEEFHRYGPRANRCHHTVTREQLAAHAVEPAMLAP